MKFRKPSRVGLFNKAGKGTIQSELYSCMNIVEDIST